MGKSPFRKKLYLDLNDATEELGISRRQLKYWEERELITPELGKGANRYTEADLEQLRLIKQLIVEQHFPIDFVSRLLQGEGLFAQPSEIKTDRFLDLDSGQIVTKAQLSERLWAEFGATASASEIEERLLQLALLLFRLYLAQARGPESYQRQRDELMDAIRELDLVARISNEFVMLWVGDHPAGSGDHLVLDPVLPDDPINGTQDQAFSEQEALTDLLWRHRRDLDVFSNATMSFIDDDDVEYAWQRHLNPVALDLMQDHMYARLRQQQQGDATTSTSESGSFDDVPF